jgi:hypothetical protein
VVKRIPNLKDVYRSIRKPVPLPSRVERDRRDELERKEASREIEEHEGRHARKSEESKPEDP